MRWTDPGEEEGLGGAESWDGFLLDRSVLDLNLQSNSFISIASMKLALERHMTGLSALREYFSNAFIIGSSFPS